MTIYKDRLVTAMALADVKPAALAEQLGVSYQAVMKVLTGKSAYFDTPNNVRAARFLGVASDWLATGDDASGTQVPKVRSTVAQANGPQISHSCLTN
jgi:transcriptional regulator with XRE-family HTH domain